MPIVLKPGQKKRGYEIVRELNRGAFAFAYEAKRPSGERVFFKQYKSPTVMVPWYAGFVEHQKELKRRITDDPAAKDKCYRFLEFFEDRDFFQVFEFIDGGKNLSECIANRSYFEWAQMVIFAKVMMLGIKALHQIKVIHTDLKPDNIILIPDDDIKGYRLRIVDLDWSIFSDQRAPWHGIQGYIGTPGYLSPEHLQGKIPSPASDIFTCGIMLGEVLTGKHPYGATVDDPDAYKEAVLGGRHQAVHILDSIDRADKEYVEAIITRCLAVEPAKRPTAQEVCDALSGKSRPASVPAVRPVPPATPTPAKSSLKPPVPHVRAKLIEIVFDGRPITTVSVDGDIGKLTFKSIHADSQFLSNPQFKLKKGSGDWIIEHCSTATNDTIVDGHKLAGSTEVKDGMRVAVGNSAKGIEKFPLVLKLKP